MSRGWKSCRGGNSNPESSMIITGHSKFTVKMEKFRYLRAKRRHDNGGARLIRCGGSAWRRPMVRALPFACLLILSTAIPVLAADLSADEVRAALTAATPERK